MEEVSNTLKNTKNNVGPGADGFTGSFYKVFWCYIKWIVLGTIHKIFDNRELTISVRLGIIALIPKSDKDRKFILNWRPLTLLETLFKILSLTLAARLNPVLDNLLGHEQKTYVLGRYIAECTRNIFTYAKNNNLPGMLLLCDFEKAFDSVNFEFILTTLDIFNFGENFKIWITLLLGMEEGKNVSAVTITNVNVSTPFKIQRGCHQGDPISGYLFILAIQILAIFLQNSKIRPYTTKHGIKHLFEIYADYLTIYMNRYKSDSRKNQENVSKNLEAIEMVFVWSGLQMNKGKTYFSIFGASLACPRFVQMLRIKWSTEFRHLGLHFGQCFTKMDQKYWDCFEKVKKELNS